MSRAHCLDCGTDVPVDTLGHCPEGHLLPRHGRMVESAIGTDDHHPDEPEPWVGRVDVLVEERPEATPSAQPRTAPGMEQAERETTAGDLLREIGALGADDPEPPPSTPSASSAPTGGHPDTNGHTGANGQARATSQVGESDRPATNGQPVASTGDAVSRDAEPSLSEHSALEQALASLDEPTAHGDEASTPAPADDDFAALFEEFEGLGEPDEAPSTGAPAAPATSASPTAPPPPPPPAAASPPAATEQHAAGSDPARRAEPSPSDLFDAAGDAGQRPAEPTAETEQPTSRAVVDTMNFTAKGGTMSGRRRRRGLFGR